jgi:DNA-binding response OmpR family regulator
MTEELAAVVVANPGGSELELLARVVTAAGFRACPVEAGDAAVVTAVRDEGAQAVLLDLGIDNLATLEALRASDDAATAAARVLVLGDGPANGRLAWQAGSDGLLIRPFHIDELRDALYGVLERPDGERAAARAAGLAELPAE